MLQMDGSHHEWFGGKKSVLIACIDDATNEIPWAEFFPSEDTFSCMKVLKEILVRYGRPQILYTDRAGIFNGPKRQDFSQFTRACEELGIHVIHAATPQAKGRVERLFRTLQDRLIPEMRLAGIQNRSQANQFLQQEFLPNDYSHQFTHPPEQPESAYQRLPQNLNWDEYFCFKQHRLINNDHTVSWNGWVFRIENLPAHVDTLRWHHLEFRVYPHRIVKTFWNNHPIQLKPIKRGLNNLWSLVDVYQSKSLGIKPRKLPGL